MVKKSKKESNQDEITKFIESVLTQTDKKVFLSDLKLNEDNPRTITEEDFSKLLRSLREFPKMMRLRPIVVDENSVVIGGNMRYRALEKLGFKMIPAAWVIRAADLTEEEKDRFIIADNVPFGRWDFERLANEWDEVQLLDWGLTIAGWDKGKGPGNYTRKIKSPVYEPKGEKPSLSVLVSEERTAQLVKDIEAAETLTVDERAFLRSAAQRHTVFDYAKIAEYYCHASEEMQTLMENSGLVIIDFNRAIELGFVNIAEKIEEQFQEEYRDDEA
jgi:arsenate reductase-like glutaredoxin family protein